MVLDGSLCREALAALIQETGEAMKRYRELADNFHGYWVPESIYAYVQLGRTTGQGRAVEPYAEKLFEEYPNSSWASRLKEQK